MTGDRAYEGLLNLTGVIREIAKSAGSHIAPDVIYSFSSMQEVE